MQEEGLLERWARVPTLGDIHTRLRLIREDIAELKKEEAGMQAKVDARNLAEVAVQYAANWTDMLCAVLVEEKDPTKLLAFLEKIVGPARHGRGIYMPFALATDEKMRNPINKLAPVLPRFFAAIPEHWPSRMTLDEGKTLVKALVEALDKDVTDIIRNASST